MLYIFHVDTGTMMTFDMNLALESVVQLKDVIERSCRIPAEKQVLLVSGGESLEPTARVCSYSAGTDTNPIYLFSKCTIESMTPPSPSIDYGSDLDLKEQVDGSLSMPATYNTVVVRAQLAQQFCELARDQTRICEHLVHDQHLQQQGWAAVVANLEDITAAFRSRAEIFEQSFNQYLQSRAEFIQLLQNFKEDLAILSKIPVIPALLAIKDNSENSTKREDRMEQLKDEDKEDCNDGELSRVEEHGDIEKNEEAEKGDQPKPQQSIEAKTLLQWISAKDNHSSLEQVAEMCSRGLEQFDSRVCESLKAEVESAMDAANKSEMKEIKGLEERLFGLEQLMFETKRIVQEQGDLAQAFLQNQNRASNLGDPSILPDLCASHRRQLLVMLKNHHQLRDIRRRCTRAKEELSTNLYHRLRWVMYVENRMCEVDSKLMIYHESLKRLRRSLEVVQQIHLTPQMYMTAVGEVVRRRTFSQSFLLWASDLACQLLAVHNEEVARRKDFQSQFEGHFLNTLFPGMEDFPPPFATQAPSLFDSKLPKLSIDDVERLRAQLPEFNISLSLPDLGAITQFFLVNSITGTLKSGDKEETTALEERLVKVVSDAGLASNLDPTLLQPADRDDIAQGLSPSPIPVPMKEQDRGFESETDTEEFEKVGQSPVKQASSEAGGEQSEGEVHCREGATAFTVATLEENLGNTRDEVERLRGHLSAVGRLALEAVSVLRKELSAMRNLTVSELQTFSGLVTTLQQHHIALCRAENCAIDQREQELVQRFTVDHELEMEALKQDVKAATDTRDEDIKNLRHTMEAKEHAMAVLRADMEQRLEEEVRQRREVTRGLEQQLTDTRQQYNELQQQLEAAEADKQRAVKDIYDRLAHDYKTELEGLRSRFRLMATTSMERSPSDSSLEKIERPDLIELVNHEAIVVQMREDLAVEHDAAVKAALEQERARWEARLEQELKQTRSRTEAEKQVWFNEAMRRVVGEKERQVEALRAREASLVVECQRHQETIRRLTDDRDIGAPRSLDSKIRGTTMWPLLDRMEGLEADKRWLEMELARERSRKTRTLSETAALEGTEELKHSSVDMSTSVAVVQESRSSRDVATSPEPVQCSSQDKKVLNDELTRSITPLIQRGNISIVSCDSGDAVLVVWNEELRNYTILQETTTIYFLDLDCLDTLGLRPSSDGSPRRMYSTGEVTEKEYCHARKSENRYKVPKGTKFYRVKVRQLQKESLLVRSQHDHDHHHHHQHRRRQGTVSSTNSNQPLEDLSK